MFEMNTLLIGYCLLDGVHFVCSYERMAEACVVSV